MNKKKMVIYFDIGLIGTFVGWEKASDDNYRYLKYVPIDSWSWKKEVITYQEPIPRSAVHNVEPVLQMKGVPDEIVYIYTEEQGSIAKKVLHSDYLQELEELRAKNQSLEMKNTSLTQEVENARAGMGKAISSARSLTKRHDEDRPLSGVFNRYDQPRIDGLNRGYDDDLE